MTDCVQPSSVYLDQLRAHGINCASFKTTLHDTCLFPDTVLHRGVRIVPYLSSPTSRQITARSYRLDCSISHHSQWCRVCNTDWERSRRMDCWYDIGQHPDVPCHGYLQLVAHRTAKIQKRDIWSLGSSSTHHSAALGLGPFVVGSVTSEWRFW